MISIYLTYLLIDLTDILWNDLSIDKIENDEECDSEIKVLQSGFSHQGTNESPFEVAKAAMTNITESFVPPLKNLQGMALVLKSDIVEVCRVVEVVSGLSFNQVQSE